MDARQPRISRGRPLSSAVTRASSAAVCWDRSVPSGSTGAAGRWCFRWCRVARASAGHRSTSVVAGVTVAASRPSGRCSSITNRVDRSTRVPIVDLLSLPRIRSPSPVPRDRAVSDLGRSFGDVDHVPEPACGSFPPGLGLEVQHQSFQGLPRRPLPVQPSLHHQVSGVCRRPVSPASAVPRAAQPRAGHCGPIRAGRAGVAASSRDIVEADLPIARGPWQPAAVRQAISSRSAGLNRAGPGRWGAFPITPPACRNNRTPVLAATPDRTCSQSNSCTDRSNHRNFRLRHP